MDSEQLRYQSQIIRAKLFNQEITENEALIEIQPFIDEWNRIAKAKAKQFGMKAQTLNARRYLRERRDIRQNGMIQQYKENKE